MLIQFVLCFTLATLASLDQVEVLVNENSVRQKSAVFYGYSQMTQLKIKCCMKRKTILKIVLKK